MASEAARMGRPKRPNPFAGGANNPLSSVDEMQLVKIPDAPETHERKRTPRGYLSGSVGPLDNLFGMLDGKQPRPPQKIEVERRVQDAPEADEADEDAGGSPPPKYRR